MHASNEPSANPPAAQPSPADDPAETISQNFPNVPADENDLNDKPLTQQQFNAVLALIGGKSFSEAAEEVGVDRRTLFNWRGDRRFIDALRFLRRDLWQDAADQMRALIHPAIRVLSRELASNYDRARFRAAAAILRHSNLRSAVPVEDGEDDT